MFKYLQNIFLTFANHQATLISWYCICHLLQTSRPSHVTVTSPSTSYYAAKSISLLSGGDRRKVIIIKTKELDRLLEVRKKIPAYERLL